MQKSDTFIDNNNSLQSIVLRLTLSLFGVLLFCNMVERCLSSALFLLCIIMSLTASRRNYLVPNILVCPGILPNDLGNKEQVRIGVMFDEPTTGYNRTVYEMNSNFTSRGEFLLFYNKTALPMVAFNETIKINDNSNILPHHHLCLYYTFMPSNFHNVGRGANTIYIHNNVRQVINALTREEQHHSHSDLMVSYNPIISVFSGQSSEICPREESNSLRVFAGENIREPAKCILDVKDTCLNMVNTRLNLFHATYTFVMRMGWKRFGIITTCFSLKSLWIKTNNVHLGFYRRKKFMAMFQEALFDKNELNIFVFIGPRPDYYHLLLEAYDLGFMTSERSVYFVMTLHIHVLHLCMFVVYMRMYNTACI